MSGESKASTTTVDPGEIKDFAKFLDAVTSDFTTHILDKIKAYQPDPELFGHYNESKHAVKKHDTMVANAEKNLKEFKSKLENVAQGTHALAGRYHDLAELNKSQQSDISDALTNGAGA